MAVGGQQQSLSIPSPSELAGGPVTPAVTPNSVAIMSDALRQGFITADDIIQRTGKRAQLKEKADVMALTEQMSPEAVQARQASITESLNRSRLGAAQAGAALPLVEPTAALTRSDLEEKQAEQTYGTGITAFKALSSEAGIPAPLTPDGKPDWAERAKLGVDLIKWKQNRDTARERLIPATWKESADGTQLLKFNKMGELISQDLEQQLSRQVLQPFSQLKPGTVETVSSVSPITVTPVDANKLRADAVNSGQLSPSAGISDEEVVKRFSAKPTITPAPTNTPVSPATSASPPVGARIAGGFSLGPPKSATSGLTHYTETQQKALGALVRGLASDDTLLNQTQKDPNFDPASVKSKLRMDAYKGGTIGQLAATIGQITPAERSYASAANAWIQGLLRAESGAAIAAKEQTWYEQTFFPSVGDPLAIQQQKSNLRKSIEQTFEQVIEGKMSPEEYQTFRDTIRNANTTSTPAAAQGKTFEIQGIGKVFRGADGKMYRQ